MLYGKGDEEIHRADISMPAQDRAIATSTANPVSDRQHLSAKLAIQLDSGTGKHVRC